MNDSQLYLAIGVPVIFNMGLITLLYFALSKQIDAVDKRLDRLETRVDALDRDLREWAKITMQHNTDIARLKDKSGLP